MIHLAMFNDTQATRLRQFLAGQRLSQGWATDDARQLVGVHRIGSVTCLLQPTSKLRAILCPDDAAVAGIIAQQRRIIPKSLGVRRIGAKGLDTGLHLAIHELMRPRLGHAASPADAGLDPEKIVALTTVGPPWL